MHFLTFSNYPQIISDKESGRVERDAGSGEIIYDLCIIVNVTISSRLDVKTTTSSDINTNTFSKQHWFRFE